MPDFGGVCFFSFLQMFSRFSTESGADQVVEEDQGPAVLG